MRARTTKAQPLTLDDLLGMRRHLAQRINAMCAAGVARTEPLQDLFDRCEEAILNARVEKRIATARLNTK